VKAILNLISRSILHHLLQCYPNTWNIHFSGNVTLFLDYGNVGIRIWFDTIGRHESVLSNKAVQWPSTSTISTAKWNFIILWSTIFRFDISRGARTLAKIESFLYFSKWNEIRNTLLPATRHTKGSWNIRNDYMDRTKKGKQEEGKN
jgi:hypothetical protein